MAAIVNEISLRRKIESVLQAKKFVDLAYDRADAKFDDKKQELMEDFEDHEVTKELRYGGLKNNNSALISKGNLFSFIGFDKDENPASDLKTYLKLNITMDDQKPKITIQPNKVVYGFKVNVPSKNEINSNELFKTPDNWDSRSWIQIIEDGVNNALLYIFWDKGFGSPPSRSGTGLQLKGDKTAKNPAKFTPMSYVTELLNNFKEKFNK